VHLAERGKTLCAVEEREIDEHGDADDVGVERFDEFTASLHGSAGGEEIVNEQHALAGVDGVEMNLDAVAAVFEVVGRAGGFGGELAGLADGDEAGGEGLRDGGAEDEAAGLGADDEVYMLAAVGVGHELDGEGEGARVAKERREVLEADAGLREVFDLADEGTQLLGTVGERRSLGATSGNAIGGPGVGRGRLRWVRLRNE